MRVTIESLAYGGAGVAKHEQFVYFVDNVVPGDEVEIEVYSKKKSFAFAKVKEYITLSEKRVDHLCEHFAICGGCNWLNVRYDIQLEQKEKMVVDNLSRIGRLNEKRVLELKENIIPSPVIHHFRNKCIFHVYDNQIGFYQKNSRRIVDLKHCFTHPEIFLDIITYVKENNKKLLSELKLHGLLFRMSFSQNEVQITFIMMKTSKTHKTSEQLFNLAQVISKSFTSCTSFYLLEIKSDDDINSNRGKLTLISGNISIEESITIYDKTISFPIQPDTFFQVNSSTVSKLYEKAIEYLDPQGTDIVVDLYSGMATIPMFFADKVQEIYSIENVLESAKNGKKVADKNGICNIVFIPKDAEEGLEQLLLDGIKPNKLIFDPPRNGVPNNVLYKIKQLMPEEIVYISCNVSTMSRDINILMDKYELIKFCPVDMYSQTYHVECVCKLKRK